MKASNNFLKRYVPDLTIDGKEFFERVTMSGTKVETYEKLDKNLSNIVVVKINKIDKHPDADKLVVCNVNDGKNDIQIVTGAPNVYVGMLCPAVLPGGSVAASAHDNIEHPDGIKIKEGKLRGVDSFGMLCSIAELGRPHELYGQADGIFDMSNMNVKPGDDVIKALGLDDTLYEFEITSNRVDCYSIIGIAREVAATFDLKFDMPEIKLNEKLSEPDYIKLDIKDNDLCKVFATRLIKNVKIQESPEWMKECLRAVGIRPINNIVDITNFVMMECGQPMHAYDYKTINGQTIVVKRANNDEKFVTLDGQERVLDDTMLMINDGNGSIGIAGIMGGENSMITENADTVLFEAANFNGVNVRLSSKKLGLRTEASNLFEKGLDPNNALYAIDRACNLVEELGCGEVVKEKICFVSDDIRKPFVITINKNKVNSLLGTDISIEEMKKTLDKIELSTKINGDDLIINVPTFRKDINNFADIAEEVVRFYGYDNVGSTLPSGVSITPKLKTKSELIEENAYDISIYNGFSEAYNYSFESAKVYDKLRFAESDIERNNIKILNPLGEDFSVMRTQLVNGILLSLGTNYKKRNKTAKLFEIANIYLPKDKEIKELPDEKKTWCFGAYGDNIDFYYMKSIADEYFEKIGMKQPKYMRSTNRPFLHPYRSADIFVGNKCIGFVGEVYEPVANSYELEKKVCIASIDLTDTTLYSNFESKYKEISKYPSVERDLSMLIDKSMTVDKIEEIIRKAGGKLLSDYELFDVYEGNQLADGFKSIAYSLSFSSKDHTLTDDEIDKVIDNIIESLKSIGVELRK